MSILKLVLKAAAPLPDIEKSERYLFIGPHPDDIEIGAGATAAKLAAMGKSVCFLICLDGRYGSETIPPDELVGIRKKEACASAKMLGVSDVRFLELSDGGFYLCNRVLILCNLFIVSFKTAGIFNLQHELRVQISH